MKDVYVVTKLISGEIIMATFEGEDEKFISLDYPVQIKTIVVPGLNKEQVIATPFCPFSDATNFVLEKSHIVYIKRLHEVFVVNYKDFVKSYDTIKFNPKHKMQEEEPSIEEGFDDLEDLTLEEIMNRIDYLEAIANAPREDLTEEELDKRVFVVGNDTKH